MARAAPDRTGPGALDGDARITGGHCRTGGLFGSSGIHPSVPSDRGHQSRSMETRSSAQRITSRPRAVFAREDVTASILKDRTLLRCAFLYPDPPDVRETGSINRSRSLILVAPLRSVHRPS